MIFLLASLFFPAPQDDPWETHLYSVEFLSREAPDRPGNSLGISQPSVGAMVAKAEFSRGRLGEEEILSLIRSNVAEDTWEHIQARLSFEAGMITVTNRRSVHEKIRPYLAYWRGFFAKMIVIDAQLVSIDPHLLTRIRAAGAADRPMSLSPEQLRLIQEAAREGKLAELHKTFRLTAHPGQRVNLQDVHKQAYLRDHDVQIAAASIAFDPVMDVLETGASIDVRPFLEPFGNAVTLELRADRADPEALSDKKLKLGRELNLSTVRQTTGADGKIVDQVDPQQAVTRETELRVELPKISLDQVRTTLTARSRETVIAGASYRAGRILLFLLTPSIVALEEKPAPEPVFDEQRLLRLYDVSPLTRRVFDWSGPRIGLLSPSAGGGGPLTGATFTLDEPAALMQAENVADLVKTRIAPDSWGNKRNSLTLGSTGMMMVRQKPEVLKEIDQFLSTLLFSRAQMITSEVVVLGFRKGSRLDWERQIPGLAPGGYFIEQEQFAKLFEEAGKNGTVRLVETAEVTGFPQERVYVSRLQEEAMVIDYEPQVSSAAAAFDPIVSAVGSGFVLEVRPHFIQGQDQIAVSLHAQLTSQSVRDLQPAASPAGLLQAAQGPEARWQADVLCAKGRWSLVGLHTRGRGEDAEELVLLLRARGNLLAR